MDRSALKYTYRKYCTLPEGSRYQLIEGDLIVSPAPSLRHQKIVKRIFLALCTFVEPQRLGEAYASPIDLILSNEDTPQPDIVYVSKARASLFVPEGIRGGPDLCVEVLAPTSEKLDRGAKRVLYARHGVTECWIVDPDANRVEVYRLQENPSAPERMEEAKRLGPYRARSSTRTLRSGLVRRGAVRVGGSRRSVGSPSKSSGQARSHRESRGLAQP